MAESLAGCAIRTRYASGMGLLECSCGETFIATGEQISDAIAAERFLKCKACSTPKAVRHPPTVKPVPVYKSAAHVKVDGGIVGEPCYDTVLRAYARCRSKGRCSTDQSVCVNDLIVATWEINSDRYGLMGYENQHPDSKRVYVEIVKMCQGNPRCGTLLTKTAKLRYAPTAAGLARIKTLLEKTLTEMNHAATN